MNLILWPLHADVKQTAMLAMARIAGVIIIVDPQSGGKILLSRS